MKILLTIAAILVALILILWLGLQIKPAPFPPYAGATGVIETQPLPTNLPAPVTRFYQTIMGDDVPVFTSVVFSGQGTLRVAGITFPSRYRFTHDAGKGYRHYMESAIWGRPLLKVNEWFLGNQAVLELPIGTTANEPKVDSAANLGLWGESLVMPSLYVTDERVRWESVDETTAQLYVPFGETEEDMFTVYFSAETGLVTHMETLRYKEAANEAKIGWRLDVLSWQTYQGMQIPFEMTATWADEGTPWLIFTADELVYNSDVATTIRGRGLE